MSHAPAASRSAAGSCKVRGVSIMRRTRRFLVGATSNVTPAYARAGPVLTQAVHLVLHPVDVGLQPDLLLSEAVGLLNNCLLHHLRMHTVSVKLLLESLFFWFALVSNS